MLDIACNGEQASNHVETAIYLQLRLKNARAGLTGSTLLILATPPPAAKNKEATRRAVISLWGLQC